MPRGRPLSIRGHAGIVSAALTGLALAAPTTAFGDVSVTRSELKSGQLRVEASGFRSSSCRATVSDGATSASVALDDCTVITPAPTPTPSPSPTPTPTPVPTSSFVIVDDVLPSGNVGTAYNASLFSRGASGNDPVEYRVVLGRLPAGLSMTRSFGVASALITGTPTTWGRARSRSRRVTAAGRPSGRRSRSRSTRRSRW